VRTRGAAIRLQERAVNILEYLLSEPGLGNGQRHKIATVICRPTPQKEQPSRLFAARRSTFDV
jgi:hypothetical protein